MENQEKLSEKSHHSSKKSFEIKRFLSIGNLCVCAVASFTFFLYITTVYLTWIIKTSCKQEKIFLFIFFKVSKETLFFLVLTHFSLFMFLWSFVKAIITHPGQVPQYWVF